VPKSEDWLLKISHQLSNSSLTYSIPIPVPVTLVEEADTQRTSTNKAEIEIETEYVSGAFKHTSSPQQLILNPVRIPVYWL